MSSVMRALLESTAAASAMIAAVIAIRACLARRMNPAVMLALWALVLARLCLPFTLPSPVRLADLLPRQTAVVQQMPAAAPIPAVSAAHLASAAPAGQPGQPETNGASALLPPAQAASQPAAGPSFWQSASLFFQRIPIWGPLTAIWALGAFAVLLVAARKARLFRRKLRICRRAEDPEILQIISRHKRNLGIGRGIGVLECDFVQVPTVYGLIRPVILLPRLFMEDMDRDKLKIVLLHEVCHIKRLDMLPNYLWLLAKAAHWFNPLVWVACGMFQDDLELCRDQMVVRRLDDAARLDYSQSLIDSARYARRAMDPLAAAEASLFENRSKVKERVTRMVQPMKRSRASLLISVVLALLMMGSCFTTACMPKTDAAGVQGTVNTTVDGENETDKAPPAATDTPAPAAANIFAGYEKAWKETVQSEKYNICVNIDAAVVTPVTDKMPVYEVSPEKITQQQIDAFLKPFGPVTYKPATPLHTKADYQKRLDQLQEYLDNKTYEKELKDKDLRAILKKEYEDAIAELKQLILDAPETAEATVEPVFTNKYIINESSMPDIYMPEPGDTLDTYSGHRTAREEYESTHTEAIDVAWEFNKIAMALNVRRSDYLPNNGLRYYCDRDAFSSNIMENAADIAGIRTTYQQAMKLAEDTVERLGLDGMTVAASAKEIRYADNITRLVNQQKDFIDFNQLKYTGKDYVFFFTQKLGGANETYCSNTIMESDKTGNVWPYVRLCVIVDDAGVRAIDWSSTGYQLGDKLQEDSALLPFDQIKAIAKEQITKGKIDLSGSPFGNQYDQLASMQLDIDKVTLGYARLQATDGSYRLVPVWDFFGSYAASLNGDSSPFNIYTKQYETADSYLHSYLTINAVSGAVIDRAQGK